MDDGFSQSREMWHRIDKLEHALRLIAMPRRIDGTYNLSREACEAIARKALQDDE